MSHRFTFIRRNGAVRESKGKTSLFLDRLSSIFPGQQSHDIRRLQKKGLRYQRAANQETEMGISPAEDTVASMTVKLALLLRLSCSNLVNLEFRKGI